MKGAFIGLACLLMLASCAPTPEQQQANQAVLDRANAYQDAQVALRVYVADETNYCQSQAAYRIQDDIAKLAFFVTPYFQVERVNTMLSFADAALKKKCFDIAEENYRGVITTYPAPAFAGYRDRAKLGLDDIRSTKK